MSLFYAVHSKIKQWLDRLHQKKTRFQFQGIRLFLTFLSIYFLPINASAEKIEIAVGLWIPPYIIKDEARGIEYDILKEVLASQGYEMIPKYVPLARTISLLKTGNIDGIMSTGLTDLPGCYTKR